MKVIDWSERRIKSRHKAPDLKVSIKATGFKAWFKGATSAQCLDINRYGMAFQTKRRLRIKERILVALTGQYINQANIPALVTQCIELDGGWRISVRFAYALDSEHYCRKMDNALSRIEGLYHPECKRTTRPSSLYQDRTAAKRATQN